MRFFKWFPCRNILSSFRPSDIWEFAFLFRRPKNVLKFSIFFIDETFINVWSFSFFFKRFSGFIWTRESLWLFDSGFWQFFGSSTRDFGVSFGLERMAVL
ncbi:uncharacterized protein OCT59_003601 [Rhizophagus irregularis]|uniref:uncharacterized protein n=1 Tax=Rhizophagus irregularis TaxID=588596 RepID=UPI00332287CA|nr:hypothetical protein OCT59_003601 [Rhizophagus irregularis]